MFGKKFFGTVALGSATVGLVGNSGQILAQNSGNSFESIAALQKFVDWLDVSKSDFEQLCVKAEAALSVAEQGAGNLEEDVYFTASRVGRVKGPVEDSLLSSRSEKILAVFKWNYFMRNYFKFLIKGRHEEYWYISFDEMKDYLKELKNNPLLLESIRFKK